MQPQPTPYDITPLPAFAYAPGLGDWLLVLGLVCAFAASTLMVLRALNKRRRSLDPFTIALSELATLSAHHDMSTKESLARASLLVKRLGQHLNAGPLPHMAPRELLNFVENCSSAELRALIAEAATIDTLRFAPALPPEELRARLGRLETLVLALQRSNTEDSK